MCPRAPRRRGALQDADEQAGHTDARWVPRRHSARLRHGPHHGACPGACRLARALGDYARGAAWRREQPRYQLFGRDMDVVQATEQGCEPNKIHVSAEFAVALTDAGLPRGLQLYPNPARSSWLRHARGRAAVDLTDSRKSGGSSRA
jgi:hypothetical protein